MELVVRRDIRFEEVDGEAVVLDRSGAVVHHVSGDAAEALGLVSHGINFADVPDHLAPAMTELLDSGVIVSSDWSRRKLLKMAGAGVAGAGIITVALASPAAAASGTATVGLFKTINGNNTPNPAIIDLCTTGASGNSGRGDCVFARTENPASLSVTITLSTGTSAVGREVFILQSNSSGCIAGTTAPVGTWAASPSLGPQTFTTPIAAGADTFVIALRLSGGGGVDGWSSRPPVTLA